MYSIVFVLLNFLARLPFGFLYFISDIFFVLVYYVIGYRKEVVMQNLQKSFPEKTQEEIFAIRKEFYRHFCDLIIESIKSVGMSKEDFMQRYQVVNMEFLLTYGEKKQSVIFLSSHHSNWEWVCFLPSLITEYFTVYAVYKPLSNTHFDQYVKATRQKHSATLIAMKETFRIILAAYQQKQVIATWMAADQTPSKEAAHWVEFLHQDTPFFHGYETLARKTKQAVLFLDIQKVKRGHYRLEILPIYDNLDEVPPFAVVEKYAQLTEQQIKRQPAYWLWSHKRWKHQR
jgi:KDO2-lipid IV(A) lauroyltransferase